MDFNNITNRIKSINTNIKFVGTFDDNNQKTGYWEEYYYDGNIESKGNFLNGIKHGFWEEFFSNGKLAWKGNYKNGLKEGYWEYYWPSGKLDWKGYYKNGIEYEF
jgi:antitoxin component YwqK of YwqJK toxin-antitoxin module